MKTLDEYLKLPYPMEIVEDQEEGGYTISFPDLPGCITCGETIEQAVDNGKEAKRLWLEAAMEEGISIPEPDNLEKYQAGQDLRNPESLRRDRSYRGSFSVENFLQKVRFFPGRSGIIGERLFTTGKEQGACEV